MVMENEIRLGDIMDKLTPSDRVVIYNAARQVVYRGYAANAVHGTLNPQRRIKKMGLGMETYRATEQMWDWEKTDSLPEQVPVIDLKKFWGISFRMALIVYSLNEEQKTCEMCRQVLLQEPECETCSTYKNTKGLQQQFEDLQRQLEKAAVEV